MPLRLRLAIVTVLVAAAAAATGVFLWPSGSHPSSCSGTVAPLPANAQTALDAYRSRIRYDIETLSDGAHSDTWLDPVTGATRILSFDNEGRLTSETGLTWSGSVLRGVTVFFDDRTWTSTTTSTQHGYASGDAGALTESLGVRRALANGTATMLGRATIGGHTTLHIRDATTDLWLDPLTYLPLRTQVARTSAGPVSDTISWLRRDASNNLSTRVIVPPGFKHVAGGATSASTPETMASCAQS
jgi:hypothetical protein